VAKEIERKFLIDRGWADIFERVFLGRDGTKMPEGTSLEQGYLAMHDPSVRVRVSNDSAWITIKGVSKEGGLVRDEYEYAIPVADGRAIMGLCKKTLRKVRYKVSFGGKTWEVDHFLGPLEGLWLAEVEVESTEEARNVELPPWVNTEVTGDERYTNAYLAEHGLP